MSHFSGEASVALPEVRVAKLIERVAAVRNYTTGLLGTLIAASTTAKMSMLPLDV